MHSTTLCYIIECITECVYVWYGVPTCVDDDITRFIGNLCVPWGQTVRFNPEPINTVNVPMDVPLWTRLPFQAKLFERFEV